jgi:hypothetical protein
VRFRQSSIHSRPLSPSSLRTRAHDFTPVLAEHGQIDRTALEMMEGTSTVGEIAGELLRRFPRTFTSWEAALSRVAQLSAHYSA